MTVKKQKWAAAILAALLLLALLSPGTPGARAVTDWCDECEAERDFVQKYRPGHGTDVACSVCGWVINTIPEANPNQETQPTDPPTNTETSTPDPDEETPTPVPEAETPTPTPEAPASLPPAESPNPTPENPQASPDTGTEAGEGSPSDPPPAQVTPETPGNPPDTPTPPPAAPEVTWCSAMKHVPW